MDMTMIIRSIIKESILKLKEDGFVDDVLGGLKKPQEHDLIIGDQKQAKAFATSVLQNDIPELKNYRVADYILLDASKEKWTFEAETSGDALNVVFIQHTVRNGISNWSFTFGQAGKSMEHMTIEVHYKTGAIPDYKALVERVNADWRLWG